MGCRPGINGRNVQKKEKNVVKNGIEFETFRETDHGSKVGTLAGNTRSETQNTTAMRQAVTLLVRVEKALTQARQAARQGTLAAMPRA